MGVAWAVCILGWLAVYLMPDQYEARSRFYVDTSSALAPFVRNLSVEMDVNQQVDLVREGHRGARGADERGAQTDLDIKATEPGELEYLLESLRKRHRYHGWRTIRRWLMVRETIITRSASGTRTGSARSKSCRSCSTRSSKTR